MRVDERAIESALSIVVVTIVLGIFAELIAHAGNSIVWLSYQQGWSNRFTIAALSGLFAPLYGIKAWGLMMGMWRLRRSLVGGRVRRAATAAFATAAVTALTSTALMFAWPFLYRLSSEELRTFSLVKGIAMLGLRILSTVLLVVTLLSVVRTARVWARAAGVAVAVAVQLLAMSVFAEEIYTAPLFGFFIWVVLILLDGAAMLWLALPVRRAWRATLLGTGGSFEGPYRAPAQPIGAWRDLPELPLAGSGLDLVLRRVLTLIGSSLTAAAVLFVAAFYGVALMTAALLVVLCGVQLFGVISICFGMARYTRAPFELPGRGLAIAALVVGVSALIQSVFVALQFILMFTGGLASTMIPFAAPNAGGVLCSFWGILLFIASMHRAARALGDSDVARRARMALGTTLIGGVFASFAVVVAIDGGGAMRGHIHDDIWTLFILPGIAIVIACAVSYVRLLRAATPMLGFGRAVDPAATAA